MSTVTRARSLADDFRRRGRDEIAWLLSHRPDLLSPLPESLSQLAMRASSGPSVRMALHQVDARTLAVAQAIAQDPVTTDPASLHLRLTSDNPERLLLHGIEALHQLGLLWFDDERYVPVREFAAVVRTVAPGAPSNVILAEPIAAEIAATYPQEQVDRSAGLHGLLAVDEMRVVLDHIESSTVGLTRDGKVVQRDLHVLAEVLDRAVSQTAMWLELGWLAGLLGPTVDASAIRPTESAAMWTDQPTAQCWLDLMSVWWRSDREWAAFDDADPDVRPMVLGDTHVVTVIPALRTQWARVLLANPEGSSVANIDRIIASAQPLTWSNEARLHRYLQHIQWQAELLGVSAHGALSTVGRALADGVEGENVLAMADAALPQVRDRIIVQADLTIIAPTPLPHELARTLRGFCVVESTGGATVYRLSTESLVHGLSEGMTAEEMLAVLEEHSDVPLPQPVQFLIRDTAASHGRVQVRSAASVLTTEDAHSMTAVLASLGAYSDQVQRVSDTVAVTTLDPAQLISAARAAGFPATGDAPATPAHVEVAPSPRIPATVQGVSPQRVDVALDALFAQSSSHTSGTDQTVPDVPRMHSAQILNVLTRASENRQQVWLLYADNAGTSSVRLISSINLTSGAVQAFDVERATVRRFAVSRIAGVQIVSEQED